MPGRAGINTKDSLITALSFQVKRVYYQKRAKGGTDISASGMVEGQLEYLSL